MAYLIEVAEFVAEVFRVELDTIVKGYDGEELGPANEQAQALANRTQYLKEKLEKLTLIIESMKDPTLVVGEHVNEKDPHSQYVSKDTANSPNGYLKLDEDGLFPADIARLYEAHYVVVESPEERLKIEPNKNLIICLDTSDNRVYYLNPSDDPSEDENWKVGDSTSLGPITKVFGRIGEIKAETGDYNADQISETETRVFIAPESKNKWDKKQDELVSGENLVTVFGKSLLDSGNIEVKDDVNLAKTIKTIVEGKNGINIVLNEETNIITFEGSNTEYSQWMVKSINVEDDNYVVFAADCGLDDIVMAELEVEASISSAHVDVYDKDKITSNSIVSHSAAEEGYFKLGSPVPYTLTDSGETFGKFRTPDIELPDGGPNALKVISSPLYLMSYDYFTDATTTKIDDLHQTCGDLTAFASNTISTFNPYHVFKTPMLNGGFSMNYWATDKSIDDLASVGGAYVGLSSPNNIIVGRYGIQSIPTLNAWAGAPTDWEFRGRNSDTDEWVTLDHQTGQVTRNDNMKWQYYSLGRNYNYKQYSFLVLNSDKGSDNEVMVIRLSFEYDPGTFGVTKNDHYFSSDSDGNLVIKEKDDASIYMDYALENNDKPLDISGRLDEFPVKLCNQQEKPLSLQFYGDGEMLVRTKISESVPNLAGLSKIEITADDGEDLDDYLVLITDEQGYISKDNKYVPTSPTDFDEILVKNQGRPASEINDLTISTYIRCMYKNKRGALYLYYYKLLKSLDDVHTFKEIKVTHLELKEWLKYSDANGAISFGKGYISFKPTQPGLHRFYYKILTPNDK